MTNLEQGFPYRSNCRAGGGGGHNAYWVARWAASYDVTLVSSRPEAFVRRCQFTPVAPEQADNRIKQQLVAQMPGAQVSVLPNSDFTLPVAANRAEVV